MGKEILRGFTCKFIDEDDTCKLVDALVDENRKLRDLAARMLRTIEWNDRISDSMYWPSLLYERELRELGIEVR